MNRFICLVGVGCVMFLITSCSNGERQTSNDNFNISYATYSVQAVEQHVNTPLGDYSLSYDSTDNGYTVVEIKKYAVELPGGFSDVVNTKQHSYGSDGILNNFSVDEKINGNSTYEADYVINRDNPQATLLEGTSGENHIQAKFPNNNIGLSSGSSDIFIRTMKHQPAMGEIWFSYDISGNIDTYECLAEEWVTTPATGNVLCKKINQSGLFETNYWISNNGLMVKIEQIMDENYSVIMTLTEYNLN